MGQRANFIVIRDRQPFLYYAHWGGGTAARELIWGPAPTLDFVQSLPPVSVLLDTTWGEGAALIDLDERRLLVFESGGEPVLSEIVPRRLFLSWLRLAWPDFEVYWAHYEMLDIARYLGLSAAEFATFLPPYQCARQQRPLSNGTAPGSTLVTVRWSNEQQLDYLHPNDAAFFLCGGPKKTLKQFKHGTGQRFGGSERRLQAGFPGGCLFVDLPRKLLAYDRGAAPVDERYEQHIPRHWRGWQVCPRHGRIFDHWLITGRLLHDLVHPIDQKGLVEYLTEALINPGSRNREHLQTITSLLPTNVPAEVAAVPQFSKPTGPSLDEAARRAWIDELIAYWRRWPNPLATSLSLNDQFDFPD